MMSGDVRQQLAALTENQRQALRSLGDVPFQRPRGGFKWRTFDSLRTRYEFVVWGAEGVWELTDNGRHALTMLCDDETKAATQTLHETPCPGCGLEPEVVCYYRDTVTKVRVGYDCTCGARVINNVVMFYSGR